MRFLLLLIVATGGLIWASPGFWLLWEMETGAARIGLTHQDGVTQWSTTGPLSKWPNWAIRPADTALVVRAHYEPAPSHPETGFGNLALKAKAAQVQAHYARTLAAAGWQVALSRHDAQMPSIPPRRVRLCHVIGNRKGRSILLSVSDDAPEMSRLYWSARPQRPMIGAVSGGC